jgi:hypothetical protein
MHYKTSESGNGGDRSGLQTQSFADSKLKAFDVSIETI